MSENDVLIEYLCSSVFDLRGRLNSAEVQINAIMCVISENAPDLVPAIKEKISDVAQLSTTVGETATDPDREAFERSIKQALEMFDLHLEGAKYSPTALMVKKN